MPPNALYDIDISEICRDGRETLPIPAELRVTMHKLGGEGKAQGVPQEVYSQGVETQGQAISLILRDFSKLRYCPDGKTGEGVLWFPSFDGR